LSKRSAPIFTSVELPALVGLLYAVIQPPISTWLTKILENRCRLGCDVTVAGVLEVEGSMSWGPAMHPRWRKRLKWSRQYKR
jgi:hypothetical protein